MMFRTASIAIFLASASSVSAEIPGNLNTCYLNYDDIFPLSLGPDACFGQKVFNAVKDKYNENRNKDLPKTSKENCRGGPRAEFKKLTGVDTEKAAWKFIDDECNAALADAALTVEQAQNWGTIEGEGVDLQQYFAGDGFLNKETGNFQQDENDFKGGYEKYIEIGTDPTVNDHYPTSQQSFDAGNAINDMATNEKTSSFFTKPDGIKDSCETNAIMCCFHRDRQYFDDNGNCGPTDCANQNPGDNTDLCWTETDEGVFPYPGNGSEKQLHCHGLAWGNELTTHHINSAARFNTLFYVSMEDHLRTRGYVESIKDQPNVVADQPMCGCVEDMAPVARADCSQATGNADYTVSLTGEGGIIEITADASTFSIEFEACEGYKFNENVSPEGFASGKSNKELGLKGKNNDLAAQVFKLYLSDDITEEQMLKFEETVVGLRRPNDTNNDKDRAEVCEEAFHAKFGDDEPYEEVVVEEAEE